MGQALQYVNMLSPLQWMLLASIPPAILLLYFLKLKREPLEVPSTFLWQRSIEDLHVNSIWQRLRRNLLLLLQLLLILLAILALLRPSLRGTAEVGHRSIFLIDQSASMSATDSETSRLDEAKNQARALIEGMRSGDQGMIIRFGRSAQVVNQFTDNRRELLRRLETIEPTQESTSIYTALRMAAGLANPGSTAEDAGDPAVADPLPAKLYIFSDGNFPDVEGFSLGNLSPVFIQIGKPDVANVAISRFNARRNETRQGRVQAFGELENYGSTPVRVTAELFVDGGSFDVAAYDLEPGTNRPFTFDLGIRESAALRLKLHEEDHLAVDNVAYTVIDPARRGRVLVVTPGNDALRIVLSTERAREFADIEFRPVSYLTTPDYAAAAAGDFDLVLLDRCRPEAMPQANTLMIGRLPATPVWDETASGDQIAAPQILDFERLHPLMQHLELGNVIVASTRKLVPPSGSQVLIDSTHGPLLVTSPRDGWEDCILGFELYAEGESGETVGNTNWMLLPSFPVFIQNLLQYLGSRQTANSGESFRPGTTVPIRSDVGEPELTVLHPDGQKSRVLRGNRGVYAFRGTDTIGMYDVIEGNDAETSGRFVVNLFDRLESDVTPREDQSIGIGHTDVEAVQNWKPRRRELWKWLLFLALVVLVLEWYIYNRRVYL